MERLIKIIDSGKPRYTLEPSHIILGRMYDHDSEELVVEIPKSESESVCTLIIADTNKTPLYSVEIKDGRYKIPSIISQHHRVLLAFSFTRNDGYIKGSEIAVGDFESTIKPFGFEPIVSSTSLEITPQTNEQVFVPETGAYYDKVSVGAVTSSIDENISPLNIRKGVSILGVDGNLEPDKPDQNKTINPTTNNQVVVADTGYELASVTVNAVTNEIDGNIQPNNIKKGVEILGVAGTLDTVDLSDATATANDIVQGKTAYTGQGKVTGTYVDRLQWVCDNIHALHGTFYKYQGTDYSILEGLDTSKVYDFKNLFYYNINMTTLPNLDLSGIDITKESAPLYELCKNCYKLKNATLTLVKPTSLNLTFNNEGGNTNYPINITVNNTEYITDLRYCFSSRRLNSINGGNTLDIPNCTSLYSAFNGCKFYEMPELKLTNTQKVKDWGSVFFDCSTLKTLGDLDMISATYNSNIFYNCNVLENLTIKNIKLSIVFNYSPKLTNTSLLNIAQELWDNTNNALGGARTLTMSTASKTNIQSIYVKLITPTTEQEAEDPYINNKKPCVECTSTDEGAMTLEEYIISKNWSIA